MKKLNGSEIVIECLKEQGVDTVFGYPGGSILNIYDALYKHQDEITHILTSHEQGAAHAADGYARATGRVGVCLATSGPGATNLVTGIATAYMDSIPIVAITCNVGVNLLGKDSFQEIDILGVTMPITKYNFIVKDVTKLADVIRRAFRIARSGRPGPVLVDITKDVTSAECEYERQEPEEVKPQSDTITEEDLEAALTMIRESRKPFIFVGGGAVLANASEELRAFAHKIQAPVTDSLMGKGAFDGTDELYTGMIGMHGTKTSNFGVAECDLLIVVGARFSDRVVGDSSRFARKAKILQLDVDPAEINKNIRTNASVIGDVKVILRRLNARLDPMNHDEWIAHIERMKDMYPLRYNKEILTGPYVIEKIYEITEGDAIITTDVGQHQMWASQFIDFENQHAWISSGGLGTMGYGLPAAIGASVGSAREFEGKKPVWLIDGDGSFQMTSEELAAAFLDHAPVKIAILNNSVYGMVRQWQTLFYEHHYSQTNLLDGEAHGADGAAALADGDAPLEVPDFIKLAEAYGCVGIRAFTEEEAIAAIEKANQINDRPVLIDFRVWKDAMVWPMVAAGAPNDEVTYKPGIKPLAGGTPAPGTGPDEHATGVFEHETAAATASEH